MPGAGNGFVPSVPEPIVATNPSRQVVETTAARAVALISPAQKSGRPRLPALRFRRRSLARLALGLVLWQVGSTRPVRHPPGVLIKDEPLPGPVPAGQGFWRSGETNIRALTSYHIKARVLPANDRVRDRLVSLRQGQLFQAGGYLVEVLRPGMRPWTSSLSRLDTGDGACEIMGVQSLVLLP